MLDPGSEERALLSPKEEKALSREQLGTCLLRREHVTVALGERSEWHVRDMQAATSHVQRGEDTEEA